MGGRGSQEDFSCAIITWAPAIFPLVVISIVRLCGHPYSSGITGKAVSAHDVPDGRPTSEPGDCAFSAYTSMRSARALCVSKIRIPSHSIARTFVGFF